MAPTIKLCCYLFCVGYLLAVAETGLIEWRVTGPRILNVQDEIIVDTTRNLTLECEGTAPVVWKYPNNTIENVFWSTVHVSVSENPRAPFYKYGALLHLINASFVDTGFYYCHETSATSMDDSRTTAKTYVYVRDEENLKVNPNGYDFVNTVQYSSVYIPCRPTSPDIQVELQDINMEVIPGAEYDRRYGFKIQVNSVRESGEYTCNFVKGDITDSQEFMLHVLPKTKNVAPPHISDSNNGHTAVGEQFVLKCIVHVEPNVYFSLNWEVPDKAGLQNGRIVASDATSTLINNGITGTSYLNISKVQLGDNGEYICKVKDHSNNSNSATKFIKVYGENDSYINLTEENGIYHIEFRQAGDKKEVQWIIKVDSHPKSELIWVNNQNQTIDAGMADTKTNKYYVIKNNTKTLFKINNVALADSGTYKLKAVNGMEEKTLQLNLTVIVKPTVEIKGEHYHPYGEKSQLSCEVAGYPIPKVSWFFKPCQDDNCTFEGVLVSNDSEVRENRKVTSFVNLTAYQSGYVKCEAVNSEGSDSNTIGFFVTDIHSGFRIWGSDPFVEEATGSYVAQIAAGDTMVIQCGASIYNYTDEINWYRLTDSNIDDDSNEIIITTNKKYVIQRNQTQFTHRVSLTIRSISQKDSGRYSCNAAEKEVDNFGFMDKKFLKIEVKEPQKPTINETNMNNSEYKLRMGKPFKWICKVHGIPMPTITWTKDSRDWSIGINYTRVELLEDNTIMSFSYTQVEDEGVYACKATNRVGTIERKMTLILTNKPGLDYILTSSLILLSIFFVVLIAVLIIRVRRENKLRNELRIAGLMNFEKGDLDCLNPDLGVDDQAELLPYDKKWEFPRDKLKLGKQLGSGAFGVVMKAEAFGISEGETITTVAVKMVKRNADCTYIKALASELKIMVHLGKNLNVVNLLGACTKNVTKRELLVIVEYCRFGNLHNYLLRHRDDFINQIEPKTGMIDVSIGAEILARSTSIGSNSRLKYAALSFANSGNGGLPCAGVDYRAAPIPGSNSGGTDNSVCMSPTPNTGDDVFTLSTSSAQQPEWRSNYRGDYNKVNVKPICTSDLLCWAFQVARGMEYLASRKVLHGDLAARNILLAEDNIVKICDFGLAKSMYKSDNYKKKGDGPLPVKWMAIESIRDRVFSTQSDAWSYGIVLWEFFSLARTPYPGMDADERLYNKLVDGYRMDPPEYATKDIYQIMQDCWHVKPVYRPSFTQLAENLGNMLNDTVRNHYIDLNNPYITMNSQMFEQGQSDYLSMLSPPDYGNLASPHPDYVNDIQFTEEEPPEEASGYLCMKPPDIFSPRPDDASLIFDFENHKKQKSNGEIATGIELLPMLHPLNESSDTETSPTLPKSFTNPSYQKPLVIADDAKEEIVKTADNYINMPQQKVLIKNDTKPESYINPSYVQMNNKKENDDVCSKNYVNSQSRDWERPYLS